MTDVTIGEGRAAAGPAGSGRVVNGLYATLRWPLAAKVCDMSPLRSSSVGTVN